MKSFKSSFNFFGTFRDYGKMKQNIINYKRENIIKADYIETFFGEIDKIFDLYQDYIQSDNEIEKAILFGQGVINFKGTFQTCKLTYKNFIELSYNNLDEFIEDKNKIFEIQLLDIDYTLEQFTKKLKAINDMYCQIGNIIYNNKANIGYEELKIVKIESGSLLSKILGDKNILEAIGLLLNKTINLVFNKYTREGKIIRQNELAKSLRETVELGEELKKLGYDISSSEENIEQTFAMVTKELLDISSSSPKIKVNEEVHKLESNNSIKFLESARTLYLDEAKKHKE